MDTWVIILAIIAILVVVKIIFKTLKILFFAAVILVVAVVVYDHMQDAEKELIVDECNNNSECFYVVDPSDCNFVADGCNNIMKFENYIVDGKECNRDMLVINESINCICATEENSRYCAKG